ncbi:hypothetical protein PybrP1_001897 [[Pythium] brassicae (nom. inval.)]|nr:hypothetical protein PybrP1_001897 [[Pythium] brassicae (nom. inval.)]
MSSSPKAHAYVMPLDYSFMGLVSLSDMAQQDPVSGRKKASHDEAGGKVVQTPADPVAAVSPSKSKPTAPATAVSLRVSNNKISKLDDIHDALHAVFDDPTKLQWLDLSGNALTSIARGTFAPYPGIFTLHLHGNKLHRYTDIDTVAESLPRLHSLTLHGNPVEEKKHYRNYVIASFPKLQQLDFSSVTKGDRERAETWATIYKSALTSPKRGRGSGGDASGDQD